MGEKPFVCNASGKLSLMPLLFNFIKWGTVERNPIHESDVENP
jgi:hypothetical protein